ncbi:MAG TPA: RHS repeat-associated core domain-containing protein [Gemmatimonadaceae bacterium]|nr:RHS repeat-associated core domain-containing protein [Gemmatimonadaceae bacterium]
MGWYALSGVFDASSYATGVYPITLYVTATDNTHTELDSVRTKLVILNETKSPVARGWTIAGVQHLYWQSADSSVIISSGVGSFEYFTGPCISSCAYTSEKGDFTTLRVTGTGSGLTWTRVAPDSSRATFNYLGQLTQISDRYGRTTKYAYDGSGRLTQVTDPFRTYSGAPTYTLLTYGTYGLQQIQEPGTNGQPGAGRITTISVASDSTLRTWTDPDGVSTQFTYDAKRRLGSIIDRNSDTTRFVYDSIAWKLARTIFPRAPFDNGSGGTNTDTSSTSYSPWQLVGVPVGSTVSSPATPVYRDSIKGSVTDAGGVVTLGIFDHWGQFVASWDAFGAKTAIARDSLGFAMTVTHPSTAVDQYSYVGGQATFVALAGMQATYQHYGAYGVLDSMTTGSQVQKWFLGPAGRVDSTEVTGSDTTLTRFYYDALYRDTLTIDAGGHGVSQHYDAAFGSLDTVTNHANGAATVTVFDTYGRDSIVTNWPHPWVAPFAAKLVTYDAINRPTALTDSAISSTPTTIKYGGILPYRVQDPVGNVYRSAYSPLGSVTQQFDPADTLNRYSSYRYNKTGLLTSLTNRRGNQIQFTYDSRRRLRTRSGTNLMSATFSYDTIGLRTVRQNAVETDTILTDLAGFVQKITSYIGTIKFVESYFYDSAGRIDSLGFSSSGGVSLVQRRFIYDARTGTLDTIRLNGVHGFTTTLQYNRLLRPTGTTYPGGFPHSDSTTATGDHYRLDFHNNSAIDNALNTKAGFSPDHQITDLVTVFVPLNEWDDFQYAYDNGDRLAALRSQLITPANFATTCPSDTTSGFHCTQAPTSDTLEYDAANNIIGGTIGGVSLGGTYTTGNRATSLRGVTHAYDLDGNDTLSGDRHYYWSADGLLDSVHAGSVTLIYEYDAAGHLVRKRQHGRAGPGVLGIFLWDGDQLVAEVDSAGATRIGEYVYTPNATRPFALIEGNSTISVGYYSYDPMGNVDGIVRADTAPGSQALQGEYQYDEWGTLMPVVDSEAQNRIRWKGAFYEGDSTQAYYLQNRWYDPQAGRFMSEDPTAAAGVNRYLFANSDWLNRSDPIGLDISCVETDWVVYDTETYEIVRVDFGSIDCYDAQGRAQRMARNGLEHEDHIRISVGCRPLYGFPANALGAHCAIRYQTTSGVDFIIELLNRNGKDSVFFWSANGTEPTHPDITVSSYQWVPTNVDPDRFWFSVSQNLSAWTGGSYDLFGGGNSNRFVYDVLSQAGANVPWAAINAMTKRGLVVPGACGGYGVSNGTDCSGSPDTWAPSELY